MQGKRRITAGALALVLGLSLGVQATAKEPASLSASIANHLTASQPTERYTACVVLAELDASDDALASLTGYAENSADPIDRLCATYALARLTQETGATERFLAIYTADDDLAGTLRRRHEQAGYPLGLQAPPERYLAELAIGDDVALDALLSQLRDVDGVQGQALIDSVTALFRRKPERVQRVAEEAGVYLSDVNVDRHGGCNDD
ncbi:hypothetical protein CAI21_17240 [Alkalilimnicola ehrlichii]|uniref:Secreted protein n=1 Tax=Alkalilimnicola ehrlichii TaxID=351052 RepID=A0A3E0WJR1_9GAMM|nr:hypothetical protein [Alkalilimnicola ehrlichii]RFA26226.1 hypothetical protein CAI21_17240 [Alkalilimnicola ehrlichii]RFA33212.1 hypothetical protein CAL65_17730 [Alkalilimnicola ehrlichii]